MGNQKLPKAEPIKNPMDKTYTIPFGEDYVYVLSLSKSHGREFISKKSNGDILIENEFNISSAKEYSKIEIMIGSLNRSIRTISKISGELLPYSMWLDPYDGEHVNLSYLRNIKEKTNNDVFLVGIPKKLYDLYYNMSTRDKYSEVYNNSEFSISYVVLTDTAFNTKIPIVIDAYAMGNSYGQNAKMSNKSALLSFCAGWHMSKHKKKATMIPIKKIDIHNLKQSICYIHDHWRRELGITHIDDMKYFLGTDNSIGNALTKNFNQSLYETEEYNILQDSFYNPKSCLVEVPNTLIKNEVIRKKSGNYCKVNMSNMHMKSLGLIWNHFKDISFEKNEKVADDYISNVLSILDSYHLHLDTWYNDDGSPVAACLQSIDDLSRNDIY